MIKNVVSLEKGRSPVDAIYLWADAGGVLLQGSRLELLYRYESIVTISFYARILYIMYVKATEMGVVTQGLYVVQRIWSVVQRIWSAATRAWRTEARTWALTGM